MVARTVAFTMLLGRLSARGAFALVPGPGARGTAARFGRRARVAMSVEAEAPAPAAEAAAEPPYVPPSMDDVVALCKRRGFVFQSSEVYNGFNGFYDFGPLGAELKAQLKEAWWRRFVRGREDVVGLDTSIIASPKIWEASGHVDGFSDPMVDCKESKLRYRADQLFFARVAGADGEPLGCVTVLEGADTLADATKAAKALVKALNKERKAAAAEAGAEPPAKLELGAEPLVLECVADADEATLASVPSPATGKPTLTPPRAFNLMFETNVGAMADASAKAFLRPETAQGIFVNFKNVQQVARAKVPFGIAQIGKAFRNEITPRNFIFRSREFEQMEIEYFIEPEDDAWRPVHARWIEECVSRAERTRARARARSAKHAGETRQGARACARACARGADLRPVAAPALPLSLARYEEWLSDELGLRRELLGRDVHADDGLAHYARACTDITFRFPFGEQELAGFAARGCFDLTQHQRASGKNLEYNDDDRKSSGSELPSKYVPHVIEPSIGVDRLFLAVICSAYCEDSVGGEKRSLLKFSPRVAPVKCAVLPLVKNKPELVSVARGLYEKLRRRYNVEWDAAGSVGKRYRRADEAGTPFCVTVDFDTIEKPGSMVTVRDRDTTEQTSMPLDEVERFIARAVEGLDF